MPHKKKRCTSEDRPTYKRLREKLRQKNQIKNEKNLMTANSRTSSTFEEMYQSANIMKTMLENLINVNDKTEQSLKEIVSSDLKHLLNDRKGTIDKVKKHSAYLSNFQFQCQTILQHIDKELTKKTDKNMLKRLEEHKIEKYFCAHFLNKNTTRKDTDIDKKRAIFIFFINRPKKSHLTLDKKLKSANSNLNRVINSLFQKEHPCDIDTDKMTYEGDFVKIPIQGRNHYY